MWVGPDYGLNFRSGLNSGVYRPTCVYDSHGNKVGLRFCALKLQTMYLIAYHSYSS